MNLNQFKSQISSSGLAKSSQWVCRLYPPAGLTSQGTTVSSIFNPGGGTQLQVNLPGLNLGSVNGLSVQGNINFNLGSVNVDVNLGVPPRGYTITDIDSSMRAINLFTETCTIPERDISNYEFSEYGETRQFGYKHIHGQVSMSYYCAESLLERTFFEEWQNIIFNPYTKITGYYADYISTMEIYKYNTDWSNIEAIYKLNEVYPTRIGGLSLRHAGTEPVRLSVIFNYRNFEKLL